MGLLDSNRPSGSAGSGRADGDVAQLEEHRVRIAGVRGSSPLISTKSADSCSDGPRLAQEVLASMALCHVGLAANRAVLRYELALTRPQQTWH